MPFYFLHIGPDKTGTSHIQRFLARNMNHLEESGYRYPAGRYSHREAQGEILSGNGFDLYVAAREESGKASGIIEDQTSTSDKHVIVSSEQLSTLSQEALSGIISLVEARGFDVRLICYARAPIDWIVSAVIQRVKRHGGVLHPRQVIEKNLGRLKLALPRSDLRKFLDGIADVVGRDRLIVRDYTEKAYQGGDILTDFLAALGITDTKGFALSGGQTNPSLTQPELAITLAVNRRGPNQELSRRISDAMMKEREEFPDLDYGPAVGIPEELAEKAAKEFTADVDYLRNTYGLKHLLPYTEKVVLKPRLTPVDPYRICGAILHRLSQ